MIPSIDIVLPLYNPHENWEKDLLYYYNELKNHVDLKHALNLIIVNDGTLENIEKSIIFLKSKIPELNYIKYSNNRGKGYALRKGVSASNADFIMYTDYDLPYSIDSMLKMIRLISEENKDIIIPHRSSQYYEHVNGLRLLISKGLKSLNKILLGLPTSDTQGGLKIFRKDLKSTFMETTTDRYLIDIDFLKRIHRKGYKIESCLVELREGIELTSTSNMRLASEVLTYLKLLKI